MSISSDFLRCLKSHMLVCVSRGGERFDVYVSVRAPHVLHLVPFEKNKLIKLESSGERATEKNQNKIKHLRDAVALNLQTHVQGCLTTH